MSAKNQSSNKPAKNRKQSKGGILETVRQKMAYTLRGI